VSLLTDSSLDSPDWFTVCVSAAAAAAAVVFIRAFQSAPPILDSSSPAFAKHDLTFLLNKLLCCQLPRKVI
jgi:hypothetical protein